MPAGPDPFPDSDAPDPPASASLPMSLDAALLATPFLGGPEQDEILDAERAALPHEEDLSWVYLAEDGPDPDDDPEGPDEASTPSAPPRSPASDSESFAVGGAADAMAPGPVLATLVDQVQRDGLGQLDDDQLTGVLQAANRPAVVGLLGVPCSGPKCVVMTCWRDCADALIYPG